jgi:hypothetical protein
MVALEERVRDLKGKLERKYGVVEEHHIRNAPIEQLKAKEKIEEL